MTLLQIQFAVISRSVRQKAFVFYPISLNVQNPDVQHKPVNTFVSGLPPLSTPCPLPLGRPDTQARPWQTSATGKFPKEISKLAVETHIRELEIDVLVEPPRVGNYGSMVCGNCHIRGHRAEGNRGNGSCKSPPCNSYIPCGQKKKHPEHFEEIRKMKKQLKDLQKEIDTAKTEKKN